MISVRSRNRKRVHISVYTSTDTNGWIKHKSDDALSRPRPCPFYFDVASFRPVRAFVRVRSRVEKLRAFFLPISCIARQNEANGDTGTVRVTARVKNREDRLAALL